MKVLQIYYFHCFICIEARETLKEIPGQLVGFMKANNIKPNPPVLRRSETTVYDHSGGCGLIHDLLTMYSWCIITGEHEVLLFSSILQLIPCWRSSNIMHKHVVSICGQMLIKQRLVNNILTKYKLLTTLHPIKNHRLMLL